MRKGEQTRARIVQTATKLIEAQGYAATGLKQVLAESGTPRGSFYFHFPGGKEDLAVAVVQAHTVAFGQVLSAVLDNAPSTLAAAVFCIEALATQMRETGCATGCPVTTIALEMANRSETLRTATHAAFEDWAGRIVGRLIIEGHPLTQAQTKARVLLCTLEGALILCRSYGHCGPLDDVKSQLGALLAP